jgi:ABC-type transport system involved in cytochrome c biogenesis permease component
MALWADFFISLLSLSRTFSAFKTGGGIEEMTLVGLLPRCLISVTLGAGGA